MHDPTPVVRRSVRRVAWPAALAMLVAIVPTACSDTVEVTVSDVYIPSPAAPDQAAVYLTIHNDGDVDDQLIAVASPQVDVAHLHRTDISDDGLASMASMAAVDVPAGSTVTMEPGGVHIMLMTSERLEDGTKVEMTLGFVQAGEVRVTATVGESAGGSAGGSTGSSTEEQP